MKYRIYVTMVIESENAELAERAINNILSPYDMADGELLRWRIYAGPREIEEEDED